MRMLKAQKALLLHIPEPQVAFRPESFTEVQHMEALARRGLLAASRHQGAFRLSSKGREVWHRLQQEEQVKRTAWWKKHPNPLLGGLGPQPAPLRQMNPLSIRFMRYVGPMASWFDELAKRTRRVRTGSLVIVDQNDLNKRSLPMATRGKGFIGETRREFLREVPQVAPRAGVGGWIGQLLVTGNEAHAVRTSLQRGGFGGMSAFARRANPRQRR